MQEPSSSTTPHTYEADTAHHERHIVASEQDGGAELGQLLEERQPSRLRVDDPQDQVDIARARQQQDTDSAAGALPVGIVTHGQAKGALAGAAVGVVIGAIVSSPLALIPITDVSLGVRLVFAVIIGAVAGATAGAVFGGGWQSDREDHPRRNDRTVVASYPLTPRTKPEDR